MIVRFGLAGMVATLDHVLVAWLAMEKFQLHPALANGLAFLHANSLAYLINTRWTFRASHSARTWRRYLAVSLFGGLASMLISGGVALAGGHELLGILLVVCLLPLISFHAHRRYTYR